MVTHSALTSSAPWWWEENLDLNPSATVTSLALTITVAHTAGVSYSGLYSTAASGALALSETTNSSTLTYRAVLNPAQTLPAGRTLHIGAQFGGNGTAHPISGDTYRVTATVGGRSITATGHF